MTYKVRAIDRSEVQCETTGDCEGREARASPYSCCQTGEQQQASTTTSLERADSDREQWSKRNSKAKRQMRRDNEDGVDCRALVDLASLVGFPVSPERGTALPAFSSSKPAELCDFLDVTVRL